MLNQTISQSLVITFVSFSLTLAFMAIGSTLIDDNAVGLINNSLMSRIISKSQQQQQQLKAVAPLESDDGHAQSAPSVDNAKFNSEIPGQGGGGGASLQSSADKSLNDTVSEFEHLLSTILKQSVLCSKAKCTTQQDVLNGTLRAQQEPVELTATKTTTTTTTSSTPPLVALNNWMRSDPLLSFMVADRRQDRDLLPQSRPTSASAPSSIEMKRDDALVTSSIEPSVHLVVDENHHERLNKRQEQVTTTAAPKQVALGAAASRQQRRTAYSSYVNDLGDGAKRAGEAHARPLGSIIKTSTAAVAATTTTPHIEQTTVATTTTDLKAAAANRASGEVAEELKREMVTSFVPLTNLAMSLTSVIGEPPVSLAPSSSSLAAGQQHLAAAAAPISSWDAKNALFNRQFSQIIHSLNITLLQPTPSPIKRTMKFMHFG